ncbi:hypothetical protein ACIQD3_11755 [Peribacillus loiseleuriae]|uniref:hypothetical protein n=1 Tax=Peribacillus loiseleuriae TaxID=1679170 RepID=UPI003806CD01
MPATIVPTTFNQVKNLIAQLDNRIYHTKELLDDEPNQIETLKDNGNIVGFGVHKRVKGQELINYTNENYLDEDAPPTSFYNDVDPNASYVWIEILDIIDSDQKKGYGRDYVDWVKAQYPNQRIYVYPIKTVEFWYKQKFVSIGNDTEWVRYI